MVCSHDGSCWILSGYSQRCIGERLFDVRINEGTNTRTDKRTQRCRSPKIRESRVVKAGFDLLTMESNGFHRPYGYGWFSMKHI
jgi:hypothetical protein